MIAEATGIAQKADAMKHLDGAAREHEEFRLRLENDRVIALEQIKARIQMTDAQAMVMAEAMKHADIKIVGGDGQFFDRFVKAVSLGSSIDEVVSSSDVVKRLAGDKLTGNGKHNLSEVLAGLMSRADEGTKTKLQALLDKAKQLGVGDDKVS